MQNKNNLLDLALRYFEQGLTPIPCHYPLAADECSCKAGKDCASVGKHPAVDWYRFQKTPLDAEQLKYWFGDGGKFQHGNIGLVTGEISGNVFVVDVDCSEGKRGDDSLRELQLEHDDLPPTMECKTGGGGLHLFYRAPAGARITTAKNVLGAGVDIRGEGGFVVASGSLHASGREYVCDFEEIADAPAWLIDLVSAGAQHEGHGRKMQEGATGDNPWLVTDGRESVMVSVILATICNYFVEHGSYPTLEQVIEIGYPRYVMKVKSRAGDLDAENRGIKLYTQRAEYQLKRAHRGDLKVIEKAKAERALQAKRELPIAQQLASPAPAAPAEDDWDKPSPERAKEREEVKLPEQRFRIQDWPLSIYQGKAPPIVWLIDGVMPLGTPVLLAAVGGLGKSFLLLDLALKVAGGGEEFHDLTRCALGGKVVSHGAVVFLTAEDSKASLHRRIEHLGLDDLRERADHRLYTVPMPDAGGAFPFIAEDSTGIHLTEAYKDFRAQLLEIEDLRLIVIDPLQAFVHADITANPAAGQFWWSTISELCTATGATVIVSHHMRKDGAFNIKTIGEARQSIRGSTALVDGARLAYALWSVEGEDELEICRVMEIEAGVGNVVRGGVVKTNDVASKDVVTFLRAEGGLLVDKTADLEEKQAAAEELNYQQITAIFDEITRRWSSPQAFAGNPKARSNTLTHYLVQNYALSKRVAERRIFEWINKQYLIVAKHEASGQPGLKVNEEGSNPYRRGG